MVDCPREVYGSIRVGIKSVRCNDAAKASVERKEATWKEVLGPKTENVKKGK